MKNFRLQLSYLFLLVSFSVFPKTIYVSNSGNDSGTGTESQPYATFAKAVSVMTAGDVCIVKGGTYYETLTVRKNGTENNYLTFKAAEGERVILKGTKFVNNWVQHSGTIYKAQVTMDQKLSNQVYYNKELMQIARWPNDTDGDRFTIDAKPVTQRGTASSIVTSGIPNLNWDGAYVWYLGGHTGASWIRQTTSVSSNEITFPALNIEKWPYRPHNPTVFRKNGKYGRYYLFGTLEVLDQGREWFYDNDSETLYFQTPNGNMPEQNSVEVSAKRRCVLVEGRFVHIEGFEIFGGNVFMRGANGQFINNKVYHGSERLDDIPNDDAQINDAAVEVAGKNTLIKGNVIEQGSTSGIFLYHWGGNGATNSIVEGNTIRYFDAIGIHAAPIRCTAWGVKILKNTISHTGRDGMFVPGNNCEIAYNDISRAQLINDDSGVFYTVGNEENKNTEIHHNWVHDSYGPAYGNQKAAGIYLDNNSKGYLVHHNMVWNITWSGIQMNWGIWNNNIYHNTIWNAGNAMASWVNGYEQKNNRVWNNYSNKPDWMRSDAYDLKNNLIDATSPFEDANNQNFMPKGGSKLVDQGRFIDGFAKPYKGAAPDIGAYELGGTFWTAGINAVEDIGEIPLDIEGVTFKKAGLTIFPNPNFGKATLTTSKNTFSENAKIEIYSLAGKFIKKINLKKGVTKKELLLNELSSGLYILKVINKDAIAISKMLKL